MVWYSRGTWIIRLMFPSRKSVIVAVVFIIALAVAGTFWWQQKAQRLPDTPVTPSAVTPLTKNESSESIAPREKHVFIVVEENHTYDEVTGNSGDLPFLHSLGSTYASATNYYATTHPSIGNYFMLTAGNIITNKDSFSDTVSDDNIVRELVASGKTWKEYSQSIPSAGYTGGDADPYEQHHNPLSYFSDVRGNPEQTKNLVPIEQLQTDIANHTLPDFAFIVPDNFHDAHDCPQGKSSCSVHDKLATMDNWLQETLTPLLESSDFQNPGGGVLIITFDESDKSDKTNGGGRVVWVAAGPDIKPHYTSDKQYQHESTLRFVLELLGVSRFPGKSDTAASMLEFLKTGQNQ